MQSICANPYQKLDNAIKIILLILLLSQIIFIVNLEASSYLEYDFVTENYDEISSRNKIENISSRNNKEIVQVQGPKGVEFSVCAIIKDDNNNLIEWTAYHYTMINMRHLVLCNDLDSVSSPLDILHRWQNLTKIDVWDVDKFSPPRLVNNEKTYVPYKYRQMDCIQQCIKHFKVHNRTWALFIDPDEFITFNPVTDDDNKCIFDKVGNQSTFDVVYDELLVPENCKGDDANVIKRADNKTTTMGIWKKRVMLPSSSLVSKSISEYIEEEQETWSKFNCHIFPRLQFGSKQETNEKILNKDITAGFRAQNFTTLSFFSHGKKGHFETNKWGKCMLDISRLDTSRRIMMRNVHYLAPNCGGERIGFVENDKSLLRINHYVGTYKQFFVKNDIHRTKKMFDKRAKASIYSTYEMQGWLSQFVKYVGGTEQATKLLEGVGEIKDYRTNK